MTGFEPDVRIMRGNLIKVIGVGGGGSNAVNHMFRHGIEGVDFYICNTDLQALYSSPIGNKVQLGAQLTDGLGAGSMPNMGEKAAMENLIQIREIMEDSTKMVFITAGMGGGTGTGAAPVIAKIAKELNILTVGIVTLPFEDEGPQRISQAKEGLEKLRPHVDALLTINNDRIVEMYGDLTITEAFSKADDILSTAARGIAEIITKPGQMNVDFMDVQTAMKDSGRAIMGTGIATGESRAEIAVRMALDSPLLDNTRIAGARHLLVNFAFGSKEPVMSEISKVKKYLQEEAGHTAHLKMGITRDDGLGEDIAITVIATGFEIQAETIIPKPISGENPYGFNPPPTTFIHPNIHANNQIIQPSFQINQPGLLPTNPRNPNGFGSVQSSLFPAPSEKPTVINRVPSSFGEEEDADETVESNNQPSENVDSINQPSETIDSGITQIDDSSTQFFGDSRMENGRRDRENILDNDVDLPAYLRRGIQLESAPASDSQLISRITIGDEDPSKARELMIQPNRHLHDNVD